MLIIIDPHSRTPVYEQIKEQVISLVNTGELKPDDKLPSIRTLASELDVNVNTVKRAFLELETEGVTYSQLGKGIFISENALANKLVQENVKKELKRVLISSKARGLARKDITEIIDEVYGKGEGK